MCWKVPLLLAFAASPGLTLGAGKLFSLSHPAWTPRVCAPIRLMEGGADQPPAAADPSAKVVWSTTKSGLRYVDEIEGSGDLVAAPMVLSVRCEGSLLSDGRRVEFDGRASPLTVALGEPELPVILEMISGMKLGGKRRVLLPPSSDLRPQSGGGEMSSEDTIRFDVEVLGEKTGFEATAAKLTARGRRIRVNWATVILFLSFIPYALPEDQRPFLWQGNAPDKGLEGFVNKKVAVQPGTEEALDVDLFGESIRQLDSELYRR